MLCYDEAQDFFRGSKLERMDKVMLNEQRVQTAKVCGSLL